jgi:hypothetical protein
MYINIIKTDVFTLVYVAQKQTEIRMEEKMPQTYLYNQYKRLGTQIVCCAIQPVHVTHTEYTLNHTTNVRSAPITYLMKYWVFVCKTFYGIGLLFM